MKKIILTAVLVFTCGFVDAQEKANQSIGAKGGLNLATVTNADGSNTLTGFHIGLFGEFMLDETFAIQPEVLYSAQGAKFDDGDLKLDYINIPVMLKYYVAEPFSIELGPQIGFLVAAKQDGIDIKSDVKSVDFSVNFGATYTIVENFMLGARYSLGVTRWQEELFPGESESKNSVFLISIGYKF